MTSNAVRANFNFSYLLTTLTLFMLIKILRHSNLNKVNVELHSLYNWLTSTKLSLNIKKSNCVIFRPYQKNSTTIPRLMFLAIKALKRLLLNVKTSVKYLGLLIYENLSWKSHIDSAANKIRKTIGLIAKLRHFVSTCTLLNIN